MSSSSVAPMSVAPISASAAALRVEILGAAESELVAMLGATQDVAPPAPHGSAPAAAPANPLAQAVDAARAIAAGEQASLAPLFADLAQSLSAPNLPAPLKAAIGQVLALQLPTDGPIAPEDVRQAVAQSGLFLEADLAASGSHPPLDLKAALLTLQQALPALAPPPAPVEAPPPAQPAATPPQAAATSLQGPTPVILPDGAAAPTLQPSLQTPAPQAGPAPPSAEPASGPTPPALPGALEAVPGPVPAPQAPAGGPVAAPVLPPAVAPSPPLAPALASALAQTPAPVDPKTALLALQQALPAAPAGAAPAEPAPSDLKAALLTLQQAMREPATAETPAPGQHTAPPAREAALSPQPPAPATLPEHAELSALAEHLRPQVEQALARLTLHQLASLPDGASSAWMFEIPVATPQGAAMAQFEVERDASGAGGADAVAPWRARFSIDFEPLGPVHVHVAMAGGKAAVSVWAERTDSLEWLRGQGAELASALPAEVVFRAGTPGGAVPASGHFLDQTS